MSDSNSILAADNVQAVIHQIRAIIRKSALDCRCRDVVDDALEGLERRKKAVATEELLKAAVGQRDKIIKLTELLRDLGEVSIGSDDGVIDEAALLFEDLAMQAQMGSQFLQAIARGSDLWPQPRAGMIQDVCTGAKTGPAPACDAESTQ